MTQFNLHSFVPKIVKMTYSRVYLQRICMNRPIDATKLLISAASISVHDIPFVIILCFYENESILLSSLKSSQPQMLAMSCFSFYQSRRGSTDVRAGPYDEF